MENERPEKETQRIEAFSDGVFAIAITLLALELPFPRIEKIGSNAELAHAFLNNWTSYLAFVISFLSVLIMWMNHHAIFRHIHKTTNQIMFANGFMLMLVIAVPFPTSLIAEYFDTPAANMAVAIYTGLSILINISYNWLWHAACSNKESLMPAVSAYTKRSLGNIYLAGFPAYVIAFIVAFFSASASIFICVLLWVYWASVIRKFNRS